MQRTHVAMKNRGFANERYTQKPSLLSVRHKGCQKHGFYLKKE